MAADGESSPRAADGEFLTAMANGNSLSMPADKESQSEADNAVTTDAKSKTGSTKPGDAMQERRARFQALQGRAKKSAERNVKEAAAESKRLATNTAALATLGRKRDAAAHKLLKADTEAAGEDFERKRAWDWTVDEAAQWDRRQAKKSRHRDDVAFQDYTSEARKVYKRQMRQLQPDVEAYGRAKAAALARAVESGNLEVVETDDGELLAVDRHGTFYSSASASASASASGDPALPSSLDNTITASDLVHHKPDPAALDRLVHDLQRAEDIRLRKRRDRGLADDDPDVTYINEKNKQFNQKLARFYDKYTTEIRDSFERGTMI